MASSASTFVDTPPIFIGGSVSETEYLTMIMKLVASLFALAGCSQAFVAPSRGMSTAFKTSSLDAVSRRNFAEAAALSVGSAAFLNVDAAQAFGGRGADYVPKFDDLKQIYVLGDSLDRLIAKIQDPDKQQLALDGVKQFNRDPKFYPGYAQNYISKSVTRNADGDPRVGYIKKACSLISSLEPILDGYVDKNATVEAVNRVKMAQALITKFLVESGVEDERLTAYERAHP